MLCGHCKSHIDNVKDLFEHWDSTKCHKGNQIWGKVIEAKQAGKPFRRFLHEAWPDLYPSEPMSEETKEALKALAERRREAGIHMPKRRKP